MLCCDYNDDLTSAEEQEGDWVAVQAAGSEVAAEVVVTLLRCHQLDCWVGSGACRRLRWAAAPMAAGVVHLKWE